MIKSELCKDTYRLIHAYDGEEALEVLKSIQGIDMRLSYVV